MSDSSPRPQSQRVVRFVKRADGRPDMDCFAMAEEAIPALKAGEFLAKNLYLSMDPALVARMRPESNYADCVELGTTMHGYGIAQIIESNNPAMPVGSVVLGMVKMQEYVLDSNTEEFNVLNLGLAEPTWYLSAVGIAGATAFFGLLDIGQPKSGETLLISAGASAVGKATAQIGQLMGLRTVGIVSTQEKAAALVKDWGYDAAVSYRDKSVDELSADIAVACPQGVDIYYDNTSGDISDAVLENYNDYTRQVVIGRLGISHIANTKDDVGRRDNNIVLATRLRKQGMVLLDYKPRMRGALLQMARWVREGKLRVEEDILQGLDQMPTAFMRMLDGKNEGKQLVQLSEVDHASDPGKRGVGRLLTASWFPTRWLASKMTKIDIPKT